MSWDQLTKDEQQALTHEKYVGLLCEILGDMHALSVLQIPGVYEPIAEHLNNEVLDYWAEMRLSKRERAF